MDPGESALKIKDYADVRGHGLCLITTPIRMRYMVNEARLEAHKRSQEQN